MPAARSRRLLSALGAFFLVPIVVTPALAVGERAASTGHAASAASASYDRTTPEEARLVDSVPTPKIAWKACESYECARVLLPLDYSKPLGPKVSIALVRIRARQASIGSLFVNPGGPGDSGVHVAMTLDRRSMLPDEIRDHFDLVGMDPRGGNASSQVRCFRNATQQAAAGIDWLATFPRAGDDITPFAAAAEAEGMGCSTTGAPLAQSASTANVARDMELLRRALDGNKGLSYVGWSYGSMLGQTYANMFPDRVRAVIVDAVVNPITWIGDEETRNVPVFLREGSDAASWRALRDGLERCASLGATCRLEDPLADFDTLVDRLAVSSVTVDGVVVDDALFIATAMQALYRHEGGLESIAEMTAQLLAATDPALTLRARAAAGASAAAVIHRIASDPFASLPQWSPNNGYDDSIDRMSAVVCGDEVFLPRTASTIYEAGNAADEARSVYFGSRWASYSAPCTADGWSVPTVNPYRGPFNRTTRNPVLVIGNYWDPATAYENAAAVHALLPNSRLIRSNAWGHAAWPTSAAGGGFGCVAIAGTDYLLDPTAPMADVTTCLDAPQPFGTAAVNPF